MSKSDTWKKGFTLVELLVVIGIIALLIAILMPALSRARKQALQVSCGSNERQTTYAAVAYANDFKEQFPTRVGNTCYWRNITYTVRLPIIGFDTLTTVGLNDYECLFADYQLPIGMGGWGFMMRDYLKNDWDIVVCPDGWFEKERILRRASPPQCGAGWSSGHVMMTIGLGLRLGYFWLPHRNLFGYDIYCSPGYNPGCLCGDTTRCAVDKSEDIARKAGNKPELKVTTDLCTWEVDPCGQIGRILSNHPGTSATGLDSGDRAAWPKFDPVNLGANNADLMPMGSNVSRIDCRVDWVPMQDLELFRWSYYGFPSYYYGHAWGKRGGL